MNVDEIKQILALMEDHDLVEVEIVEGEKKVRLRKAEEHAPAHPSVVVSTGGGAPTPAHAPASSAPADGAKRPDNVVEIRSPLVGTFYTAPKPGAEAFVNVGDAVNPEKVVCLVEAMKVMNEIKAEVGGKILEVLAKNGQPVEYNEPLFLVEKTR